MFYFFCFSSIWAPQAGAQERGTISDPAEEEVHLLYNTKPSRYLTGAVSQITGEDLMNVAGVNRMNTLSGRLPGLLIYNIDGLPGYENSTVSVRGNHTFGSNTAPLILIDGRVDDSSMLDPYDIESITVLKDAAASAIYGLRSANGIILITTKRGKEGKIAVNFNTETSFSQPTCLPEFLDAANYAVLYNEALKNDNPGAALKYDASTIEAYKTGSNPYKYPNVNWTDEFLKKFSVQTRNNINVSGGTKTAKYYFSANYLHDDGLFDIDKDVNTYNTNSTINVINAHANVELKLGKNLTIVSDIKAKKDKRNAPGAYSSNYDESIFSTLFSTPFNAHPIKNEDGSIAGTTDYRKNPYGLLNGNGYSIWERSSLSTFVELTYNLDYLLKGLKISGWFGFNNYNDYYISRTKNFAVYQLNPDEKTYAKIGLDSEIGNTGSYSNVYRNFDHSVSLSYSAEFQKHTVHFLLMADRQQLDDALSTGLALNYQGIKGSLSYRYNNTYLLDFSYSRQGSEQYPKGDRYGFFPVISAGWIVSNEKSLKLPDFVNLLKIRASYGLTGNHDNTYFDYLESFASGTGSVLGISPASVSGYYQNKVANPLLTWEKCLKTNIGFDMGLFKSRFSASVDYFKEENKDILIKNAITSMYGADVYMPEGKFKNKGYEIQLGWNDRIRDLNYYISFNYAVAKNKIVNQNEQLRNYSWMYRTGHPLNTRFGYLFDRFYTEEDDIDDLPDQSLLGSQNPGDLKYKDLNSDGVIDDNDITRIGSSKMPEINYGLTFGAGYKGFDFSVLFHGAGNSTTYNSGYTYWDFYNKIGNVTEHHLDRWTSGSGQSAEYPRLTLSNTNNYVTSSYWVEKNSFLRLKYIELGYTLPGIVSKKIGMTKARIFVNGSNLYCRTKLDHKDPELQDDGLAYPIPRVFSAGLNLHF
jgi:TonB-linked SusC/RagA family outer membrane protein